MLSQVSKLKHRQPFRRKPFVAVHSNPWESHMDVRDDGNEWKPPNPNPNHDRKAPRPAALNPNRRQPQRKLTETTVGDLPTDGKSGAPTGARPGC